MTYIHVMHLPITRSPHSRNSVTPHPTNRYRAEVRDGDLICSVCFELRFLLQLGVIFEPTQQPYDNLSLT